MSDKMSFGSRQRQKEIYFREHPERAWEQIDLYLMGVGG